MDRNDMIVQEGNKSAAIFGIKSNFDMWNCASDQNQALMAVLWGNLEPESLEWRMMV